MIESVRAGHGSEPSEYRIPQGLNVLAFTRCTRVFWIDAGSSELRQLAPDQHRVQFA